MSLGATLAVALIGVRGAMVEVEADLSAGLPAFILVGLPDASLMQARDRVRAAAVNSGAPIPTRKITVNLSPASLPKSGAGFDLAIAVATLAAAGLVPADPPRRVVHLAELGLDGRLRPIRGILPSIATAVAAGFDDFIVAPGNQAEAELVPGAVVHAFERLGEVVRFYGGNAPELPPLPLEVHAPALRGPAAQAANLADIVGQDMARHAAEVAAAGAHHLLLVGPPGAGKTMIASRVPSLLPDLDDEDAVEVTAVHSVAGTFDPAQGLIRRPPFESPHHTATGPAIIGGGSGIPRPGAASLAHRGVLFLDEAPELSPRVLESLREPLETGELVLHRALGSARYPARFQLVLAANPCPCGKGHGKGVDCICTALAKRRYFSRLSGPILDRVDVQVRVERVRRVDLLQSCVAESSAVVAERVARARSRQHERWQGSPWRTNAEVAGGHLRTDRRLPSAELRDLDRAMDRGTLTMRGYDRVLRLAWTLADLADRDRPERSEIGEALALRGGAVA